MKQGSKKQSLMSLSCALCGLLALSACSDFRQAIGKEKSVPDEFEVVIRPPLSLPPNFTSRPKIGEDETKIASTQTISATSQASSLFESGNVAVEGYDEIFDFSSVPSNIRELVDEETAGIRFERRLPIQVVFGGLANVGPVLDQMAEDQRLRKNRLEGKSPLDGGTPAIDNVLGEKVIVE